MKFWLIFAFTLINFTACEQQKQASKEVGAIPKEILDKAKTDIQNAEALVAKNLQAMENLDAPAKAEE